MCSSSLKRALPEVIRAPLVILHEEGYTDAHLEAEL